MDNLLNIDNNLKKIAEKSELMCKDKFKQIENIEFFNENKMLSAFIHNKISASHFVETSGYGYGDLGKYAIDNLFKYIFKTESSLARCNFVSGTHAISVALFGILNPNDQILSITGTPYDTIQQILGITKSDNKFNNLKTYNINFSQIELTPDSKFDFDNIKSKLENNNIKLIYIQRSRGYSTRSSIRIDQIEEIVSFIKKISPNTIIFVDNCYGEFVEEKEPTEVGVNLMCGSLIKNPGGGIAQSGGYIVGDENLVEKCAHTLTAPGLGREVGCNFNQNKNILMGFFLAPHVVANALKVSAFSRALFTNLGLKVFPTINEQTSDIVSTIELKTKEALLCFCKNIQGYSPIDSFVTPQPCNMPGYEFEIIMAAGTFTNGSSIELSADAQVKPPYNVFLQGGLTYNYGKICILNTIQQLINENLI